MFSIVHFSNAKKAHHHYDIAYSVFLIFLNILHFNAISLSVQPEFAAPKVPTATTTQSLILKVRQTANTGMLYIHAYMHNFSIFSLKKISFLFLIESHSNLRFNFLVSYVGPLVIYM